MNSFKERIQALFIFFIVLNISAIGQTLPSSIVLKDIPGGVFTMGSNNLIGSPSQKAAAPEHEVTVSPFSLSEAEITNAQYLEFLNSALNDGLIEIVTGTAGPDNGKKIIQGTANSSYSGKVLYTLDGTRVMKDHDNADNDGNPFTGVIEPENPLNISYIGFNNSSNQFYIKNPIDPNDFNWFELCNYFDYGTVQGTFDTIQKNDFDDWSGSGKNLSNELQGWTLNNPSAAVNLPTQNEVANWPVTFIRWWGAKAFADYYNVSLPTEAQWEFAAKAGQNFTYAVYNGTDLTDANWNINQLPVATGHVREAISGTQNPFGLYNLGGNVWEWIADNYVEPYDLNPVTDPFIEVPNSTLRCWRGGSWNYHEATLQSAMRFSDEEDRGNDHFGFRIASTYLGTGLKSNSGRNSYIIYPNPADHFFTIKGKENETIKVEIYNIQGVRIFIETTTSNSTISTENIATGVYIISVNQSVSKLIIE